MAVQLGSSREATCTMRFWHTGLQGLLSGEAGAEGLSVTSAAVGLIPATRNLTAKFWSFGVTALREGQSPKQSI
jgi:hypothetical protein